MALTYRAELLNFGLKKNRGLRDFKSYRQKGLFTVSSTVIIGITTPTAS